MKAGEVLEILQITRPTLKKYRERGYLKAAKLPTNQFDYDANSVYLLKNKNKPRMTVVYGRVSMKFARESPYFNAGRDRASFVAFLVPISALLPFSFILINEKR